jgi:hypothetical protein
MPDRKKSWAEALREDVFPNLRNKAVKALLFPGGVESDKSHKQVLHVEGNRRMTKAIGKVLPPQQAAHVTDALYGANEAVTGALAKVAGRDYFSPYGYNVDDLRLNKQGQDAAVRELEAEAASRPIGENKAAMAEAANKMFGAKRKYFIEPKKREDE